MKKLKKTPSGSTSVWVGQWLHRKGYDLASCTGLATPLLSTETDSIGILIRRQNKPGQQTETVVPSRRLFVGTLWFKNFKRGADRNNWVLEVYGEEYFESFQKLGKELWSTFYVSVEVKIILEEPETEMLSSDITPI